MEFLTPFEIDILIENCLNRADLEEDELGNAAWFMTVYAEEGTEPNLTRFNNCVAQYNRAEGQLQKNRALIEKLEVLREKAWKDLKDYNESSI